MNTDKYVKVHVGLFIGIVAGFAFLIYFFAGVGLKSDEVMAAGLFFTLILIAILPLLFQKKRIGQ